MKGRLLQQRWFRSFGFEVVGSYQGSRLTYKTSSPLNPSSRLRKFIALMKRADDYGSSVFWQKFVTLLLNGNGFSMIGRTRKHLLAWYFQKYTEALALL